MWWLFSNHDWNLKLDWILRAMLEFFSWQKPVSKIPSTHILWFNNNVYQKVKFQPARMRSCGQGSVKGRVFLGSGLEIKFLSGSKIFGSGRLARCQALAVDLWEYTHHFEKKVERILITSWIFEEFFIDKDYRIIKHVIVVGQFRLTFNWAYFSIFTSNFFSKAPFQYMRRK